MTNEHLQAFTTWLNLAKLIYPDARLEVTNDRNVYKLIYTCPKHGLLSSGYGGNGIKAITKTIASMLDKKHLCLSCMATAQLTKTLAQNTIDIKALILKRYTAGYGLLVEFLGMRETDKMCKFKCPEHGVFYKLRNAYRDNSKFTCEGCSGGLGGGAVKDDTSFIVALAKSKHVLADGEVYTGSYGKLKLKCVTHDETFTITPNAWLAAKKEPILCKSCKREHLSKPNTRLSLAQVNKGLKADNLNLKCLEYGGAMYLNKWECLVKECKYKWEAIGGSYEYINNTRCCPKCALGRSTKEKEVYNFVLTLAPDAIFSHRLYPKLDKRSFVELDIYVPSKNLAIEFNGTYWHSSAMLKRAKSTVTEVKSRHESKTWECNEVGIKLLHIWEHDWQDNQSIVKSMITSALVKQPNIKSELTKGKIVTDLNIINTFYKANSLQGKIEGDNLTLALTYNKANVLMVTLKPYTNLLNTYEITRIASTLNVVGGIEKLLTYFIDTYMPDNIIGYSDQQYSKGLGYEKLGFTKTEVIKADYKVVWASGKTNIILDKSSILKANLIKIFGSRFDKSKSIFKNCISLNLHRIYDAGRVKWELNPA